MASNTPTTEHSHGTMDIRAQEKTFVGFINVVKWTCIISALVLIFLALTNV